MDVSDVVEKDGYFLLNNGFELYTMGNDIYFRRGTLEYVVTGDPYLHVYSCIDFGEITIQRNVTQIAWMNHAFLQETTLGFFKACSCLEYSLDRMGKKWRFIEGESLMYWAVDNGFSLEIVPSPSLLTMRLVSSPNVWRAEFISSGELVRFRGALDIENGINRSTLIFRMDKKSYLDPFELWQDTRNLLLTTLKERAGEVDFSQK